MYPYLLRRQPITRAGQAYAMDITCIPMPRGFVYPAAVMDGYSRKVLAGRVSTTLDVHFCREVMEEAITRYSTPEIVNTDQGLQCPPGPYINGLVSSAAFLIPLYWRAGLL